MARDLPPDTIGLPVAPAVRMTDRTRTCDLCERELRCTIAAFISVKFILCLIDATRTVIAFGFSECLTYSSVSPYIDSTLPPIHSQNRTTGVCGNGRMDDARIGIAHSTLLMPIHLAPWGGGKRGRD